MAEPHVLERTWFTDTLSKRLLILMWLALVGSHVAAFLTVRLVHAMPGPSQATSLADLPTFPSLPPTPGLPDTTAPRDRPPEDRPPPPPPGRRGPGFGGPGFDGPAGPGRGPADESPRGAGPGIAAGGGPRMPWDALALDYGVRFGVIALAAWLGSRWLARPMRRLAVASRALSGSLGGSASLPTLDETSGTVEVREAAHVFNAMARQLREQFQARGLMVAAISHDLRTPLTRMRMRLEAMGGDQQLQQRSVDDIQEMNALIDNVMEVFRLEAASGQDPLQPTDIGALVQAVVDNLAEQGSPATFEGDSVVTLAQPEPLRRVVSNLVSNAIRYGERAEVRLSANAREVRITVDDSGPGIPPAELEAVFQPFYRVEASRHRSTGGTGLGLYIAREMTARQGGRLSLVNLAAGGLRAELVLPRR
ncbi:sensor histidine kinase [Aquabacterium sp.]|uniref:sensor histidine kinase n=1 Tax=Aquabacterium sp. TaxID=1872578 RepID=UPI002C32940E|nr:ATP-binding protein [Aquabacterium sp.]HSW03185.1 ATP-binding protein [Aquabacterium sp.]